MCTNQIWKSILQGASMSLDEFGSSRNEENKISSIEMNGILKKEDEGQHNKSPGSKSENLKDYTENPCRNAIVEYKMHESEEWKKGKIINTAKINWKIQSLVEYKTRSGKGKTVSIGIIVINGDFYIK